jgi:hypothetical protein
LGIEVGDLFEQRFMGCSLGFVNVQGIVIEDDIEEEVIGIDF